MTAAEKGQIYSFWLAVAGFLARTFTHWLTPMHEWMHGIPVAFLGGEITKMEHTRIWFVLPNMDQWHVVVLLGFWLEMFMYWSIAMIFHRRFVGKVAAGIMPAVVLYGLRSTDFQRVEDTYPANMMLFTLIGLALCVVLLYRVLPDNESACKQTTESKANQAKY